MWKEGLGISDCFYIIGSRSQSKKKNLVRKDCGPSSSGQPVGLPPLPKKSSKDQVRKDGPSSSGQPVGLAPLPKKSSVDLVSSFIPLFLFS